LLAYLALQALVIPRLPGTRTRSAAMTSSEEKIRALLEKIAEACNVSVAWLVGEADDPAGTASQEQTEAAAAAADDLASAVAKLATIFQSNDQGFIRAIQANLDAFSAAVERQEANMQLEKRVEELEAKMARIMNMRDQDGKQVANH